MVQIGTWVTLHAAYYSLQRCCSALSEVLLETMVALLRPLVAVVILLQWLY